MRKVLFLLLLSILLVACSDDEGSAELVEADEPEVEAAEEENAEPVDFTINDEALEERTIFVEDFNHIARGMEQEVNTINSDDFQDPRQEEILFYQNVYDESATIEIIFDSDGELKGYDVHVKDDFENNLVYATLTASVLELDVDTFVDNFAETYNSEDGVGLVEFNDNGYDVMMVNLHEGDQFLVNFYKTSQ